MTRTPRIALRTATPHDLPIIHDIAARAVRDLLAGRHYSHEQLRAAAAIKIYEVEPALVDAGTYYVAEIDGAVVAGSGWSAGGPLQPTSSERQVTAGTAAMRATYVDPRWARRGLATLLAHTTETAARLAGYRRFEALCTPASEALRRSLGYHLVRREEAALADGVTTSVAHMRKLAA